MEIREHQNLFSLLGASFSITNRAGVAFAVSALIILVILAIPFGAILLLAQNSSASWLLRALWVIFAVFCFVWLQNIILRIIASKAENNNESVSDAFVATVIPTFYAFIYQLIINVLCAIAAVALSFIPVVGPVILSLLSIYIGIRLLFGQMAIVLREQGPVSAIVYSWQLTAGRVLYILGALLLSGLLPLLLAGLVIYGGIVGIPLYFADSFTLPNLPLGWIIVLILFGFAWLFVCLSMAVFIVLVFLNLDYGFNRDTFIPQPQTAFQPQRTEIYDHKNHVLPSGAGHAATAPDVPSLEVLKASVHSESDNSDLHQHLDQVYQPKPEDIVEYTEEDRMPTILFDDEMAKQLEQERTRWQEKAASTQKQRKDDENSSIKMSK